MSNRPRKAIRPQDLQAFAFYGHLSDIVREQTGGAGIRNATQNPFSLDDVTKALRLCNVQESDIPAAIKHLAATDSLVERDGNFHLTPSGLAYYNIDLSHI